MRALLILCFHSLLVLLLGDFLLVLLLIVLERDVVSLLMELRLHIVKGLRALASILRLRVHFSDSQRVFKFQLLKIHVGGVLGLHNCQLALRLPYLALLLLL